MPRPVSAEGGSSHCASASCATALHAVLFVTYAGSNLHKQHDSATWHKLQRIAGDFSSARGIGYQLVLLYQRNAAHEPFRCTLHGTMAALCADYGQDDLAAAFGQQMALRKQKSGPIRRNVGFWVGALWLMQRERGGSRRFPFVWYVEDDVFLPGSWSEFMRHYDMHHSTVDLLTPQHAYGLTQSWTQQRGRRQGVLSELDVARGLPLAVQNADGPLLFPRSTLRTTLPVTDDSQYSKVSLYIARMSGRLVSELAQALARGARSHEEFLLPTACRVLLRNPSCALRMFDEADIGIPCGTSLGDSWERANRKEFTHRHAFNRSSFETFFAGLQAPGGVSALPLRPHRLYHPVKGQMVAVNVSE